MSKSRKMGELSKLWLDGVHKMVNERDNKFEGSLVVLLKMFYYPN